MVVSEHLEVSPSEAQMDAPTPSLGRRLWLAFGVFWRILLDADLARDIRQLVQRGGLPATAEAPPSPPRLLEVPPNSALQLLGLMQQEGRFIDFLEEDVQSFSDAEVGAAARVVHEGCRTAVREHFTIVPIRAEEEGASLTLSAGFDASMVRLTGNVVGEAPFTGRLVHRGWRASEVRLPKVVASHDLGVLAPAEVEL